MTRDEERELDLANDEYHLKNLILFDQLKQRLLDIDLCVDNEYLDKYCQLIITNKNTQMVKGKTHKHHIIPRFYFKINKLKIDNSENNLVILFRKEHALAHYYLFRCSKNKIILNYNFYALEYILPKKTEINKISENEFLELIQYYNDYEIKLTEETKKKISKSCKGLPHPKGKSPSLETRKKLSLKLKGRKLSSTCIEKLKIINKGENNPFYNGHHDLETRKIIGLAAKGNQYRKGIAPLEQRKENV